MTDTPVQPPREILPWDVRIPASIVVQHPVMGSQMPQGCSVSLDEEGGLWLQEPSGMTALIVVRHTERVRVVDDCFETNIPEPTNTEQPAPPPAPVPTSEARDSALEEAARIADEHWPEAGHQPHGEVSCPMSISIQIRRMKSNYGMSQGNATGPSLESQKAVRDALTQPAPVEPSAQLPWRVTPYSPNSPAPLDYVDIHDAGNFTIAEDVFRRDAELIVAAVNAAALRSEPRPQPTSEELASTKYAQEEIRRVLDRLEAAAAQGGYLSHTTGTDRHAAGAIARIRTEVERLFARSQEYTRDEVLRIATAAATMHHGYPGKGWDAADAALAAIEAERSPKEGGE